MRDILVDLVTLPMPILWLLVQGLVLWRREGSSRAVFLAGTLLFLALGPPASGKLLVSVLQAGAPAFTGKVPAGTTAILVPSGGTFNDGMDRWWPTRSSVRRLAAALRLREQLGLPIILTGGSPQAGQPPEVETLAARYGLQGQDIRLETTGRTSSETAQAVATMFPRDSDPRIILVTDPTHIARTSAVLRHHGFEVVAAEAAGENARAWSAGDFLPSGRGLAISRGALWEYMGIAWYLATGRLISRTSSSFEPPWRAMPET